MFFSNRNSNGRFRWGKKILALAAGFFLIFVLVGYLTTMQPTNRLSSSMVSQWTSDIDSSIFLHLLGMENRALMLLYEDENQFNTISKTMFHLVTSIKPNDFRSLLGNELPGFSRYDREILIAGEGTDYTNLPIESSFPLEDVLEDRQAVYEDEEDARENIPKEDNLNNVVFIYNTHNRESFLPHLPDVNNPNHAHHSEVNITKVSERLKGELAKEGIGAIVDDTDIIGEVLVDKGWEYWQSYHASREVVAEASSQNGDLKYAFDLHRDAVSRDITTKDINGVNYARVMFVIGEDNPSFEKNYEMAKSLHEGLQAKYPGLSRGVVLQGGAGNNGVYNQDLSDNLVLIEVGGIHNTLEETYQTARAIAEVFSEYYWEAEAVQGN